MSALPPKADIGTQPRDVRFVPIGDIIFVIRGPHRLVRAGLFALNGAVALLFPLLPEFARTWIASALFQINSPIHAGAPCKKKIKFLVATHCRPLLARCWSRHRCLPSAPGGRPARRHASDRHSGSRKGRDANLSRNSKTAPHRPCF
jgi:hypothetical protein